MPRYLYRERKIRSLPFHSKPFHYNYWNLKTFWIQPQVPVYSHCRHTTSFQLWFDVVRGRIDIKTTLCVYRGASEKQSTLLVLPGNRLHLDKRRYTWREAKLRKTIHWRNANSFQYTSEIFPTKCYTYKSLHKTWGLCLTYLFTMLHLSIHWKQQKRGVNVKWVHCVKYLNFT